MSLALPERKRKGLEALLETPPAKVVYGNSGHVYSGNAFCCLRPHAQPRLGAIRLVEWPPFETCILLTIVCTCITMAWESPLDPEGTTKALLLEQRQGGEADLRSKVRAMTQVH